MSSEGMVWCLESLRAPLALLSGIEATIKDPSGMTGCINIHQLRHYYHIHLNRPPKGQRGVLRYGSCKTESGEDRAKYSSLLFALQEHRPLLCSSRNTGEVTTHHRYS